MCAQSILTYHMKHVFPMIIYSICVSRDNLISQLQERISDLTLFLEEERLNHKQTKQKVRP